MEHYLKDLVKIKHLGRLYFIHKDNLPLALEKVLDSVKVTTPLTFMSAIVIEDDGTVTKDRTEVLRPFMEKHGLTFNAT